MILSFFYKLLKESLKRSYYEQNSKYDNLRLRYYFLLILNKKSSDYFSLITLIIIKYKKIFIREALNIYYMFKINITNYIFNFVNQIFSIFVNFLQTPCFFKNLIVNNAAAILSVSPPKVKE